MEKVLRDQNYDFSAPPAYARFSAGSNKVKVVAYESGKIVVQGKETREFVEFTLEPCVTKKAILGYESVHQPELLLPRIGVDESGKGDFFGPMCVAAVYVNSAVLECWKTLDVKDSKHIGSDRRISEIAKQIKETKGCVWTVVPIGNAAYNRLYKSMRSVNRILAWGHARVIENLMLKSYQMDPKPVRAISDQFAQDKATVARALMQEGRNIELIQRHKAESDAAVAAASILARDEFVKRLGSLSKTIGYDLPKGASPAVDKIAQQIFKERGEPALADICKAHFRNWYRAQGLAEPPKKEWRKKSKE